MSSTTSETNASEWRRGIAYALSHGEDLHELVTGLVTAELARERDPNESEQARNHRLRMTCSQGLQSLRSRMEQLHEQLDLLTATRPTGLPSSQGRPTPLLPDNPTQGDRDEHALAHEIASERWA